MEKELSKEQIAHDLAVAYTAYVASKSDLPVDLEPFAQEYEQAYMALLGIVNRNC